MTDVAPSDHLRVQVAFTTDPNDPAPAWEEMTSRAVLAQGVDITRGRNDEHDTVTPGKGVVSMENLDGALTPDNAAGAYYPNVLPQRRLRISYRDPATLGVFNLDPSRKAAIEDSSLQGWWNTYAGAGGTSTIAADATHVVSGTKSVKVTWPTLGSTAVGAGVSLQDADGNARLLVKGRTYVARMAVWVPTGSPAVQWGDVLGGTPVVTSTVLDQWQVLQVAFVAASNDVSLGVRPTSNPTAGQVVWVDLPQVDEAAPGQYPATSTSFPVANLTTAAAPISDRFDGYVEEWPVEWPTGDDTFSWSVVVAGDILARLARADVLGSVIQETLAFADPDGHWPLGEAQGTSSAGDVSGGGSGALTIAQLGTGGTLEFGAGTGPGTDGLTAPVFTPASSSNGLYLTGPITAIGFTGATLGCDFSTTTAAAQILARVKDPYGSYMSIGIDATGHLVASTVSTWRGGEVSCVSAAVVSDGNTHEVRFLVDRSGGTLTGTLYLDGVSVDSDSTSAGPYKLYDTLVVGGDASGSLFTGTIAHVVTKADVMTTGQVADQAEAATTGFAGETTDERIARIASWLGIPATMLELDVCTTGIAHVDCTNMNPLDYMQQVAQTEAGVLFASRSGKLVLHSRSRLYSPSDPEVTIPSRLLDPSTRPAKNLQGVVNDVTASRPGGGTTRMTDDASIEAFGALRDSMSLLVTTDAELADAVAWRLANDAQPVTRIPELVVDAYTEASFGDALRALEIGSHVAVSGMPSQAPSAVIDQIVQGCRERIAPGVWDITATTTNYSTAVAFTVEDAVYGFLDGPGVLVY